MSPLRVWEETWHMATGKDRDGESNNVLWHGDKWIGEVGYPDDPQGVARAKLAAKAPEMARTLMVLAGMGTDPYCNGCGDTSKRGHKRDCALMQLLFEAGVGCLGQSDRSPCLALVPSPKP